MWYITTLLIIGIIITGSIEHVTIPLFSTTFPSTYFVLLMTSIEGLIVFGITFMITLKINNNFSNIKPDNLLLLIFTGMTNGLMSLCLLYAANPARTPVLIQSVFLGLAVIPSVIFTKIILDKKVSYIWHWTLISLIFLGASIMCAVMPTIKSGNFNSGNVGWIFVYMLGIILLSLTNILQEKYTMITDNTFENKIKLAFYAGFFQVLTAILLCWIDLFFGYCDNASDAFGNFTLSARVFFTDVPKFFMIQLFVFDCLALFILSIYLNNISTNYNMILTNLTNQSVALFFTIFPNFNNGIHVSPIFVTISLLFNIVAVILWIKGEVHEYIEIK